MLVHPNPMERTQSDHWEDTKLGRVFVRPFTLNYGNHRKRWAVWSSRRKGGALSFSSRHITEEQAVVSAQTLANRLYLQTTNKKKKVKALRTLNVDAATLKNQLDIILASVKKGDYGLSQDQARDFIRQIKKEFGLK